MIIYGRGCALASPSKETCTKDLDGVPATPEAPLCVKRFPVVGFPNDPTPFGGHLWLRALRVGKVWNDDEVYSRLNELNFQCKTLLGNPGRIPRQIGHSLQNVVSYSNYKYRDPWDPFLAFLSKQDLIHLAMTVSNLSLLNSFQWFKIDVNKYITRT